MFGFLNVDKPLGMTSHDVVDRARRKLKQKRIGHAGTLDPLASGVLILCVGMATRLSEYVMDSTKRYRARLRLGVETESYDGEGAVTAERDASHITPADVERALIPFMGDIQQIPPMYSAIKHGGVKLYDLARAGETVERQPRAVRIDSLTIHEWSPSGVTPEVTLDVTCSAGTYIRSLAHDLGAALGVGAYLTGLIRTGSGKFTLDHAVNLTEFLNSSDPKSLLTPPTGDLIGMVDVRLDAAMQNEVFYGRYLPLPDGVQDGTRGLASTASGEVFAVLRAEGDWWKPEKVFSG